MATTRSARARSRSVRAPLPGPISTTRGSRFGQAAAAIRSRTEPLMRKCWPSFWRDTPASALDYDSAAADDDSTRDRLQKHGGRRVGGEQQEIADIAVHLPLQHRVIHHPALAIDLDFNERIVAVSRTKVGYVFHAGFRIKR